MHTLQHFISLGPEALVGFFDAANALVFRDSRAAQVQRLSIEARHLYLAYVLNGEVLNGGYSQFFSNTSGDWVSETVEALQTLQATPYFALLERACLAVFGSTSPPRDRLARYELLERYESANPDTLEELDSQHYALLRTESFEGLLRGYLEAHPAASLAAPDVS